MSTPAARSTAKESVEDRIDAIVEETQADETADVLPGPLSDLLHEVTPPDTVAADHAEALAEVAAVATSPVFAPDPLADLQGEDPGAGWPDPNVALPVSPDMEAELAAARSGVVVRPVETHVDVAAATAVLDEVFSPGTGQPFYPPSLLRNMLAAGTPILLAVDDDEPVGVILALPGWGEHGPVVQSGPMAVVPAARGRRIAVALKLAQRSWCLSRGVTSVNWTFDALNATNARLNLRTLRADAVEFLPGFEGPRVAGSQALPYDRLLVRWNLTETTTSPPTIPCPGHRVVAAVHERNGVPVVDTSWISAHVATVELPLNIVSLRRDDPELAARWQYSVGHVLRTALESGWRLDVDPAGRYCLHAPGPSKS